MTRAESSHDLPVIIQGGMGIGVSNWRLARAVSRRGQLGVVSATAIDTLLVRRLQDGDPGGHMRRAMERFPIPGVAADVTRRFFLPKGRPAGVGYRMLPMYRQGAGTVREQLTMLASFVEVWLAKEGHDGRVGVNLLTKVQLPNPAELYGAMLADVDYVLMGAGIPKEIPAVLDAFAGGKPASLRHEVDDLPADRVERLVLDPADYWAGPPPTLRRPAFLAVIASNSLATMLARKASGRVDGFVIEGPTAGGHNAPPRGAPQFNGRGEPLYGERDEVDVRTDPRASPTGYPFKVVEWPEDPVALAAGAEPRERVCDIGGLRVPFVRPDGRIGYRCPAEPRARGAAAAHQRRRPHDDGGVPRRPLALRRRRRDRLPPGRGPGLRRAPLRRCAAGSAR